MTAPFHPLKLGGFCVPSPTPQQPEEIFSKNAQQQARASNFIRDFVFN